MYVIVYRTNVLIASTKSNHILEEIDHNLRARDGRRGSDVEIWIGDQHISLPFNVIVALICLFLIARFRRQVLSDYKKWNDAHLVLPPSLGPYRPPATIVADGASGCAWSFVGALSMALLTLIVIDQLFARGAFFADVLTILFSGQ